MHKDEMKKTPEKKCLSCGIGLTILAACCFGLIPMFAKMAYSGGFNPYSFSLFRMMSTAGLLWIILKRKKLSIAISREQGKSLLYAAFFGYYLMMVTLCVSYNHMATGLATTLHFIYPVATMVGAVLFFKERITPVQVWALVVSILGIFLLTGLDDSGGPISLNGFILAVSSGIFYAWYILIVSHGAVKDLNSFVVIFYIVLFNTIFLFLTCLFMGNFPTEVTSTGLLGILLVALVSSVVGMVAFQAGLKQISATSATILSPFELITSLVVGIAFLGEELSSLQVGGCVLIVLSVVAVALSEGKKQVSSKPVQVMPFSMQKGKPVSLE